MDIVTEDQINGILRKQKAKLNDPVGLLARSMARTIEDVVAVKA
jgi:hypothetical protein